VADPTDGVLYADTSALVKLGAGVLTYDRRMANATRVRGVAVVFPS
jgi:hypothetical protein